MDLTSNPPPRSTILTSQHWFLGVLCAPLEWPCRALSFHHLGAGCMHPAAPRSSCACPHSLPFIIVPLDDPLLPSHHPGSNFHPFFQPNLSTFHSNLFSFRFFTHVRTPILVLHHHPGCHCPPNSTGTPPAHLLALCHPHQPPPSQIFDFFNFLCTGPAPTPPATPPHSAC